MSDVVWSRLLTLGDILSAEQWINDHGGFCWYDAVEAQYTGEHYVTGTFDDPKTAMLFKLTWG